MDSELAGPAAEPFGQGHQQGRRGPGGMAASIKGAGRAPGRRAEQSPARRPGRWA